ncbi:cyclic nucleotide-binding domain-containing protein [Ruegeria arenilitoris]|uniref:cyclic nucleotide-binding domain-containing protein n=1 Tax=Ruegeria arenilitoris TaxID=1173585 RepID=UPI00147B8821|nr:cyclic nucleotide-binding domain-containing protein [Ruegeria arenilitoris]
MWGLDVLVNSANIFYLLSYSAKDIFWLRVLSVIGACLLLPYYYLQDSPLWAPIGWNLFFSGINAYWIVRIMLERRPVPFTDEERRLYEIALRNFSEQDAFALLRMGVHETVPAGTDLLVQGTAVDRLTLIVDGEVRVDANGEQVDTLGEGRFLGGTAFLSDHTTFKAPVSVATLKPTRVVYWPFSVLEAGFQGNTNLHISIEASLGLEISRFLASARTQLH